MSKKNDDKKNLVIVGGGHFGALLARKVSASKDASNFNIILIDPRPYALHLPAAARIAVKEDGELTELSLMSRDKLFFNGNGTTKLGLVTAIEETAPGKGGDVVLSSGERVPYTALVLATGSRWAGPLAFPDALPDVHTHLAEWRKKFAGAKHVVLVGGGSVGVELAGEIRDAYPDKKITIVHGSNLLLNSAYPDKFRKGIEKRCQARKINVIYNEYIDELPEAGIVGVKTRSGKTIDDADVVVPTFGPKPNTEFISTLGSDVLSSGGRVKIQPTFEVQSHPGVFAMGDIIDWPEQHMAGKALGHIPIIVPNVISYLKGEPLKKVYKGSIEMIVLPVGKDFGLSYVDILWGITLGDWFARWIKGKDLLVGMTRKDRGL